MHDIEILDAQGREKGRVIYSIHQCRAGWGVQWYEGGNPVGTEWRTKISVYSYYPTISEMIEAETERVAHWEIVTDA